MQTDTDAILGALRASFTRRQVNALRVIFRGDAVFCKETGDTHEPLTPEADRLWNAELEHVNRMLDMVEGMQARRRPHVPSSGWPDDMGM